MARRTSTALVRSSPSIPTIRLALPRTAPLVRSPRRHARRRSSSGGGSAVTPVKVAITAAVIGMAEKSGVLNSLPTVPVIGRKGAIALAAWYWARHGGGSLARDVCLVSAAICGYQYGKDGTVDGD